MKAYKGSKNGKCINITYEEGKTYTMNGKMEVCEAGFHFCENPKDTLTYCNFDKDFQLMEIEVLGDIEKTYDKIDNKLVTDKSVTNKFRVIRFISNEEAKQLLEIIEEYDERGNVIHYKNGKYEWWKKYDERNNLIHYKDSSGLEFWQEFDENKNVIHYKDSNGFEEWYKYDERNNLIHSNNSNGIEACREYDARNNLIRYKKSNGLEYSYEYDDRNNIIHSKGSIEFWYEYDERNNLIHYKDSSGLEFWQEFDERNNLIRYNSKLKRFSVEIA